MDDENDFVWDDQYRPIHAFFNCISIVPIDTIIFDTQTPWMVGNIRMFIPLYTGLDYDYLINLVAFDPAEDNDWEIVDMVVLPDVDYDGPAFPHFHHLAPD